MGGSIITDFHSIPTEKQQLIIKIGLQEFTEKTFNQASTNSITEKAKISKGSLFAYFNNKAGLFEYLIEYSVKHILDHYSNYEITKHSDLKTRVLDLATVEWEFYKKNPMIKRFFMSILKDPEIRQFMNSKYLVQAIQLMNDWLTGVTINGNNIPEKKKPVIFEIVQYMLQGLNEKWLNNLGPEADITKIKHQYLAELSRILTILYDGFLQTQ